MNKAPIPKRKKQTSLQSFVEEHGRIPPQALELEESILGAIMLEKDALNTVIDILKPEAFYNESHQKIFEAVQRLFAKSEPIDMLTVVEQLRKSGDIEVIGGPAYIAKLTRNILSAANIEYHARIVLQKFIQRELIKISSEIIRNAYDETTDVFDLLNNAEEQLFGISEIHLRRNMSELPSLLKQAKENIDKATSSGEKFSGVPSGFTSIDRITAGWQKSDLIILASRPAMGKTAFALSMARNIAVNLQRPIAFFSLEMSAVQLATRLLSGESQISQDKIRRGELDTSEKKRLNNAIDVLSDVPFYVDDTPALSVFELRTKCRKLKQKNNIEIIFVDYLQLMINNSESFGTREQEISGISRALKALSKELNIPIICLSQLSRNVENRPGQKRPQLSDLRESGSIEQDADLVLFLYRPEYYKLEPEDGNPGSTEVIVSKHRNGPTGTVRLKFINQFAQFKEFDSFEVFSSFDDVTSNENLDNQESSYTVPSKMNNSSHNKDPDF